METPSLGRLPTKTKDPNLTMRHGYPPPDAKPVFQYHGIINIIIIELAHSKAILENSLKIKPQPADFENLS